MEANNKKNFLKFFSNKRMQDISIKNKKNGVLLPESINEKKSRKNKIIKVEYSKILFSILKNKGIKKKLKIPNLNM